LIHTNTPNKNNRYKAKDLTITPMCLTNVKTTSNREEETNNQQTQGNGNAPSKEQDSNNQYTHDNVATIAGNTQQ